MTEPSDKFKNYQILAVLNLLFAFSVFVLVYCAFKINSVLIRQSLNYRMHLNYHIANDYFRQGTDILTNAVRRYVATMKPEYMEEYFHEAQVDCHREKALNMVKGLKIDQGLKNCLANALDASRNLMDTEYHAMHLIADGTGPEILYDEISGYELTAEEHHMTLTEHRAKAQEMLWDDAYINTKNAIYSYLAQGLENASASAMKRHLMLRKELVNKLYFCAMGLTLMIMTIFGYILYRRSQHLRMVEEQAQENARMNVKLKEERDKSIQAEKAKSYFFSSVSHDIRTPLNAIIGFSEMLQLGIDDPREKEKALDAIITSSHTLLELINDVLDLSKLEAGKMEIHPTPTNIADLVSKVATSFEAATTRVSVRINTEVQKMPYLLLDPQRIRQILFNLIGNAVKFTTKGYVNIKATYEDGTFTLAVTDTGCGISEEDIQRLMQPYVQLQGQGRINSTGTGLGLAICKQLTAQMHGTLGITSTLGKGSTFTLRIPNVVASSEQESEMFIKEQNKQDDEEPLPEALFNMNILIVDDQKLNRSILRTMLTRLGFDKILSACNGQEALELMQKDGNVGVVLTDMFMPVLDGTGLVREIRKMPSLEKIPVYAITADVEMQNKYKDLDFDDMLIKPITLEKLKGLLSHYAPRA